MNTCEVLVVGGGPAGSSCAWKLRQAGLDVIVMDKASFPRDKVCAGWITPGVLEDLDLDVDEYRKQRVFQPITSFRIGLIGEADDLETSYGRSVSFGILRREFDEYLLRRSGACLRLGTPVQTIRRDGEAWVVNESVKTSVLVGAGGHFCPVARWLNPSIEHAPLVVAQEVEFRVESGDAGSFATANEEPELYFCHDLKGYGWCFRKGEYINVGLGRMDSRSLPEAHAAFIAFLKERGRIPLDASWRPRGHAYLVSEPISRQAVAPGLLLVGDAAGLAYPQSGEGIRPAVESGLLAAAAIAGARGCYGADRLGPYKDQLQRRFATPAISRVVSQALPGATRAAARWLLHQPWFVRRTVLDRWFLHAHEPALVRS